MSIKTATPRLRIGPVDPDSRPTYKSAAIDETEAVVAGLESRPKPEVQRPPEVARMRARKPANAVDRKAWAATNAVDFEIQHAAADGIR
ncbi:hypothetical protein EOD10_21650 [Mesorhizobium sp. M7A.T.Ca.TU.009.01.3.2]|nr:hypothetical protein EOD10_21650 [Mesorhizobium sp. M7A.T.Ca.TU.009.01.3.2]RUV14187.1 hypothetical protein EOD00_02310 [Mesorhizobium sp. M7A.T.Ca.TU.009.01.3.1]